MNNPGDQIKTYEKTNAYTGAMFADPHSLITQMIDGALTRISQAKGAIIRGEIANKAELISKAILIIGSLEGCLDHDKGGELSQNLASLYEYMSLTLAQANIHNDIAQLEEVSNLMLEIKSAWIQIPEQLQRASA
ncbi:MAG: flagellar export chaperone FliS [Gammaproteobacteria bacterium]|nr:flagellar export chaperone FliS [Gammaproteobacteria bacterium]